MRQTALLLVDLTLVLFATIGAVFLRNDFDVSLEQLRPLAPYAATTLGLSAGILPTIGANRGIWRFSAISDYLKILAATAVIVGGALAFDFSFNRLEGVPRALPILQALLIPTVLISARIARRGWRVIEERRPNRKQGKDATASNFDHVLVVGLGPITKLYLRSVAHFSRDQIRIVGLVSDDPRLVGQLIDGRKILGAAEDLAFVLRDLEIHGVIVDRIVVACPLEKMSQPEREALLEIESASNIKVDYLLEQLGLTPPPVAEASETGAAAESAFRFDAAELAQLDARPYWRFRRGLDVLGAATLLLLLGPVMPVLALLIAVDIGSPVTFWQQRPGLNGRPFKVYKFRTMKAAHDEDGERVPDELRSSPIGRFLRLTRLDELPQLFNILIGEMSFIGPRPLLPIDQPAEYAARLLIRPGLTGWAQVMGGRAISAVDKAALDVWYVRNASLALDIQIVVQTFRMVFFGERVDHLAIQRAWRDLEREGIYEPNGDTSDVASTYSPAA